MNEAMTSREALLAENEQLKSRNLVLELRAQRLASPSKQKTSSCASCCAPRKWSMTACSLLPSSLSIRPYSQQVLINKGGTDGVFISQPVLDAYGLPGRID